MPDRNDHPISLPDDRKGLFLENGGHRCWLKWHRGRRAAGDIPFTAARIHEGMKLGASVEVDLGRFQGDGFVVLHDEDLHPSTTGRGPVTEASAALLQSLHLTNADGSPSGQPVLMLDELVTLLRGGVHADACLQLDIKAPAAAIRPADVKAFTRAIAPLAASMILSAGEAEAVERLSQDLPDLKIGYDPCHFGAVARLMESRAFDRFVADAVRASPRAQMMYLEYELVLFADRHGFDMIGAFHAESRHVDAYTIRQAKSEVVEDILRLLSLKADQITTDDPIGLEALVLERAAAC